MAEKPYRTTATRSYRVRRCQGFSYLNSELWVSMITLFLVILFYIVGSGRFSTDEWMRRHPS